MGSFFSQIKPWLVGIRARTGWGYLAFIICLLVVFGSWRNTYQQIQEANRRLVQEHTPLVTELRFAAIAAEEGRELIRSLAAGADETQATMLQHLHNRRLRQRLTGLSSIMAEHPNLERHEQINRTIRELDLLLQLQQRLLSELSAATTPQARLLVQNAFASEAEPQADALQKTLNEALLQQTSLVNQLQASVEASYDDLDRSLLLTLLFCTALGLLAWYLTNRSLILPLRKLATVITQIGKADQKEVPALDRDDEVGEIYHLASQLTQSLNRKASFATQIGHGNYAFQYQPDSADDQFGLALLEMCGNLKQNAEAEYKRNWITNGMAEMGNLLRDHSQDSDQLHDRVLAFVVKYMGATQGALYVADTTTQPAMLNMVSCYAYDRRKYRQDQLLEGEGLVGQVLLDQQRIYMTDVPADYLHITSGLGEAPPRALLIVPLKVGQAVPGVIELASFDVWEDYQLEFMDRAAEGIAATIQMVAMNARTRRLLLESQQQTEEMRAQEEEMRQNMEELAATQEEIERRSAELDGALSAMNSSLLTMSLNLDGMITDANQQLQDLLGYPLHEVFGKPLSFVVDTTASGLDTSLLWHQLRNGQSSHHELRLFGLDGRDAWVQASFTPIKNVYGVYDHVLMLASDITQTKVRNLTSDALLDAVSGVLAVAEADTRGILTEVNPIFCQMTRYDRRELLGMDLNTLVMEQESMADAWHLLMHGEVQTLEQSYQRKDGTAVHVRVRMAPVQDLVGQVAKVVLFAINLNKLRYLEAEVERLKG